ncbi:alpha/beta fold hydrolase [Haloarcula salinisoli]|uniref:Alpha/beta hydrolase n=1 Tax=Haloarcula salinisoli TaxID=2487746 RepID=A0A8J8C8A1_9EURY|nr:alpha/beta hydrolase [Halomicroarcula salinisoli]MBX0286879.1 alpha/beta hydrolase [Halomicroarcula salinisoli]MBX0304181.1 alpha/beta hydrolase [Halomicroarcula salinisoli]
MTPQIASERVELSIDGDDVGLHYKTGGSGPPLVFLHGIGLDAATVSWRHALPALAEERTVYAPDLPGHGESDKPDRAYTTEFYLEAVEAFLDAVDVDEPAIAGLSMGGALALGHALDGGSVERLVLVNSYGLGGDAYWRTAASGMFQTPLLGNMVWQGVSTSKPAIRTGLRSMGATEPPQELVDDVDSVVDRQTVRAMRRWQRSEFRQRGFRTNYADRLDELSVPTLLIHGSEDPLFPPTWSQQAATKLAESELKLVKNCGHNPPRERPEWFNSAVRSFCASE